MILRRLFASACHCLKKCHAAQERVHCLKQRHTGRSQIHCLKQWHTDRRRQLAGFLLVALMAPAFAIVARGQTTPTVGQDRPAATTAPSHFAAVDIFVDSGLNPMGAYQFELTFAGGDARIVGVEGGELAAYAGPPFYDPAALHGDGRIIIAAFSTDEVLPTRRNRVARVHVQIVSEQLPEPGVQLIVAGAADGSPITASIAAEYAEEN